MGADDDYAVDTADAGAAEYEPVQASTIKKGSYMMVNDRPCKVEKISTSKPGKHGSAKCNFTCVDIFTGKKMEAISPAHATVNQPFVIRKEYQLSYIDGDALVLLDDNGEEKRDLDMPKEGELAKTIKDKEELGIEMIVTVISACSQEKVIEVKDDK